MLDAAHPPERRHAEHLDATDPLASFRDRFVVGADPVAYLDGNSLGRLPKATLERVRHLMEVEWGTRLIRSWDEQWFLLPSQVGDRLGAEILGAAAGQTIIADSTTVNLYKALHAACALRPGRSEIVIDQTNFPTDRFVVEAVAGATGRVVRWVTPGEQGGVTAEELTGALSARTAAVVLSHVDYRSAYLADLEALTELAHAAGALAVWDLSHSAGAVPVDLDAAGVDMAIGCTYKYLNAGPGAPAYLYVARRHQGAAVNPIPGWFGAADVFAMAERYQPAPDVRRMLSGTPSVTGIVAVDEGVNVVAEAGLARIRAKSVALTEMAVAFVDFRMAPLGAAMISPRDPARRGGHIVVRHPQARTVAQRMTEAGVLPDFRNPDLIRLGLSPLTTSFVELWTALELMEQIIGAL